MGLFYQANTREIVGQEFILIKWVVLNVNCPNAPTGAFPFSFCSSICKQTQNDCLEAQPDRHPHSDCFNYFTHWNQRSYMQADLAPHCLLCMHTHTYITHTLAELSVAFGTRQSGSVRRGLRGLHCWPHLPTLVQASFPCGVAWSGVSTTSGVLEKSFSLCGQMRGSSQIASLMTFLLSLELLSLPKDNFPMMTKVSDSINFHLSEKCGSN